MVLSATGLSFIIAAFFAVGTLAASPVDAQIRVLEQPAGHESESSCWVQRRLYPRRWSVSDHDPQTAVEALSC